MVRRHHQPLSRRRKLSQHFIKRPALARRIAALAAAGPGDVVVEPGPGHGILTDALAARGCRVIAVEKDVRLYRSLRARFVGRTNVELHHADFLTWPLPHGRYHVVANVPYAITAALVRKLVEARHPPVRALLVLQAEAAEKFAGHPRETLFSLLHKPRFAFDIAGSLSRDEFTPRPRVASRILRIALRPVPLLNQAEERRYAMFVRAAFGAGVTARAALRPRFTRSQLVRLARELDFRLEAPPSELTFSQWLAIWRFYEHVCLGRDPNTPAATGQLAAMPA
jgi:23S rRNA (adenine-N6)-dimethyltransferase